MGRVTCRCSAITGLKKRSQYTSIVAARPRDEFLTFGGLGGGGNIVTGADTLIGTAMQISSVSSTESKPEEMNLQNLRKSKLHFQRSFFGVRCVRSNGQMALEHSFTVSLGHPILPNLVTVGYFDGEHPCLT